MELTPQEIQDRVTMTVACTAPEALRDLKPRLSGYITQLENMMAECKPCGGITIACPRCFKADEVLTWIRHNLRKIDKELGVA